MQVGHGLHEAGIEFSESDVSAEGSFAFSFFDAAALEDAEFKLAVVGEISQEIGAAGFAFDETDLR